MKHALVICALMIASGYTAYAFADPTVEDAEHMVVVTSTEAIHFKGGGAFFELKKLLASGVLNKHSAKINGAETQAVDVYLIGGGKLSKLQVGPNWLKSDQAVRSLSAEAAARLWHIVESRGGTGTSLDRLERDLEFLVEQSWQEGPL